MNRQHKCRFSHLLCKDSEIGWLGDILNIFNFVLNCPPRSLCANVRCRLWLPTASHFHTHLYLTVFSILPLLVYWLLSVAFVCISKLASFFFWGGGFTANMETQICCHCPQLPSTTYTEVPRPDAYPLFVEFGEFFIVGCVNSNCNSSIQEVEVGRSEAQGHPPLPW